MPAVMITLTEDQKRSLKTQFRFASDRDLIFELVRRERFAQIEASESFWTEMREADGYMDSVKERAMRKLAQGMLTLPPKSVIEGEHRLPTPGSESEYGPKGVPPNMMYYHAALFVLTPRKERDDVG